MEYEFDNFWKGIGYLVSLLIATVISLFNFRRTNIDKKIENVINKFNAENVEQSKVFKCLGTSKRSKKEVVSYIISECSLMAREDSIKKIKNEKANTIQSLERISEKSVGKPASVSFICFTVIIVAYFLQHIQLLNNCFVFIYCIAISAFLWIGSLWKTVITTVAVFALLPIFLVPILSIWFSSLSIVTSVIVYFVCLINFLLYLVSLQLSKPISNKISCVQERMNWITKYSWMISTFIICSLHVLYILHIGEGIQIDKNLQIHFFKENINGGELLFTLLPLFFFIYFLINLISIQFLFIFKIEDYLNWVLNYNSLSIFICKEKELGEKHIKKLIKKKGYYNSLQMFVASGLDGLLLRKIQIHYEETTI